MIEVNLLPSATKRSSRGSKKAAPALPRLEGPKGDRWTLAMILCWIFGLGVPVWLFLGTSSRMEELNLSIEQAVQDSTRYARLIAANEKLIARRDSIAQKLEMIQEIDAGRYIWPHILDEVGRALPDYTWLTKITRIPADDGGLPGFELTGRTGNLFALTRFMKDLEASPFIRGVQLRTTDLAREGDDRAVQEFILVASFEEPSPEVIQTVPIFALEE